jgi:hypothetical protein
MITERAPLTAKDYQVFHPPLRRRVFLRLVAVGELIAGFMAVWGGTFITSHAAETEAFATVCIWLYLSYLSLCLWIRSFADWLSIDDARIVVSPEGIEIYSFGYGVVSEWKNVRGVERTVVSRDLSLGRSAQTTVECLVLRRNSLIGSRLWARLIGGERAAEVIPLQGFDPDWRMSPLADALRVYIPTPIPNSPLKLNTASRMVEDIFAFSYSRDKYARLLMERRQRK